WTRPGCSTTPAPASPTATATAWAPRWASAPASCTHAARWGWRAWSPIAGCSAARARSRATMARASAPSSIARGSRATDDTMSGPPTALRAGFRVVEPDRDRPYCCFSEATPREARMRIEQRVWSGGQWSGGEELSDPAQDPAPDPAQDPAQLVLLFGGTDVLASEPWRAPLRARHPEAQWFGCSTAGEIHDTRVHDDTVIATAIRFEDTPLRLRHTSLEQADGDSRRTGGTLARSLPADDLRHVLVLSDGQQVNGSELVRGMLAELPPGVQVT